MLNRLSYGTTLHTVRFSECVKSPVRVTSVRNLIISILFMNRGKCRGYGRVTVQGRTCQTLRTENGHTGDSYTCTIALGIHWVRVSARLPSVLSPCFVDVLCLCRTGPPPHAVGLPQTVPFRTAHAQCRLKRKYKHFIHNIASFAASRCDVKILSSFRCIEFLWSAFHVTCI